MTDIDNDAWFREFVTGELRYLRISLDELRARKEPVLDCAVHRTELDHLLATVEANGEALKKLEKYLNRALGAFCTLQVVWMIWTHFSK